MLVFVASGAFTAVSVRTWYRTLARPPGAPPDWLFGPVWAALYPMIGVSAWLVWRRIDRALEAKRAALRLWGWQLLANAVWPPLFFGLQSPALGLVGIVALWTSIALTLRAFWPLSRPAAALLVPYLAWVSYATWLNAGFWWLNR